MRIVAIILGTLMLELVLIASGHAQTTLPPGSYIVPACGATSTATPVATPTPVAVKAFSSISMPTPPLSPDSSLWPFWSVQPSGAQQSSTLIAYVNVTLNGVLQPSYKGGGTGHTFDYRLGGFPIPGVTVNNGTFNWLVGKSGTYSFVFSAYNDAGQLLQSVPMQQVVP